jgi:hypothetical protein
MGVVSSTAVTLGSLPGYGKLNGLMDDTRIYSRALSATEIATQYKSYNSQINLNSSPASSQSAGNINTGLIGYWPFNGNAKDATPYSNNGTVNGAVLGVDRRGRANSAYVTGSTGKWINVGSPSTFSNLSNGFTYSVWLNYNGTASSGQWPEIMGASNTHIYYGIRSSGYGASIYFEYGTTPFAGSTYYSCSSYSPPVATWHLYTYTFDGSTIKYYRDGAFVTSCPVSGGLSPTFGGLSFTMSSSGWNGSMDDARVYNRPLSANEVAQLYIISN